MDPETTDPKALATRVVDEVVNGTNPAAARRLLADDVVVHALGAETETTGIEEFEAQLTAWSRAVPDVETTIQATVAEGDEVVCFCTMRGTQRGEYAGVPPTGKSFEVAVVHRFRVADGKVVEWWRLTNALGMLRQLGLLPDSPGAVARLVLARAKQRLGWNRRMPRAGW